MRPCNDYFITLPRLKNNSLERKMRRLFLTLATIVVMFFTAPLAHAVEWFDVLSTGGETIALNPEIITSDNWVSYLVWVRNTFDLPESRAEYSRERGYDKTVAYKLTLYKFTNNWKNFNIVQVSVYDEKGELIDQYANPDMAATESVIPHDTPIHSVAENAKVIYEITTHPE